MPAITPAEAKARTGELIPEEVLEAVNSFLIGYSRGQVVIRKRELIAKIVEALGVTPEEISRQRYLEFSELYREQGWDVQFEAPDRGDSGDSYWRFSAA